MSSSISFTTKINTKSLNVVRHSCENISINLSFAYVEHFFDDTL